MKLLKKAHTSANHRFTYPNAVLRVNNIRPDQRSVNGFRSVQLEMSVFASESSLNEGGQPVDTIFDTVQVDELNFQTFISNLLNSLTETEKYSDGTII